MKKLISCSLAAAFILTFTAFSWAQAQHQYVFEKKISLPGNNYYDYVYLDQQSKRLYASHGAAVDVIDVRNDRYISSIKNMKKVHGITVIDKLHRGFITDGGADAIIVFNTRTLKIIKTMPLGSPDCDCILYDSWSKKIFSFEGDGQNTTVINPVTMKVERTIELGGSPEFAVSNGKGKIFNNLEDKNSLDVINASTFKVIGTYSLTPCEGPTGLALDAKDQRLFTVCRGNKGMSVVDATTGRVITTVSIGAGVDAVVYDPVTHLVICSNGDATATVIQQKTPDEYAVIQTIATQYRAKTMTLDLQTHKIYFSCADFEADHRHEVPGTFKILVYRLK
ncbi:MAG: YncE family protein [Chitinophagaceae bacterium]|nr:MAG: YncE family protein [Chitinophagaceae bacterium]